MKLHNIKPFVFGIVIFSAAWMIFLFCNAPCMAADISGDVRERIRQRLEYTGGDSVTAAAEKIYSSVVLPRFYEQRGYRPAWLDSGAPSTQSETVLRLLQRAGEHGLNPVEYHVEKIGTLLEEVKKNQEQRKALNPGRLADLDFLLTDAFLIYGAHLLGGKVNPETIEPTWTAEKREADLAAVLEDALKTGQMEKALESLAPQDIGYKAMQAALKKHLALLETSRLPRVDAGSALKPGDRDPAVAALRSRLEAGGFLNPEPTREKDVFDSTLEAALKQFQISRGLESDGVCGSSTRRAINQGEEESVSAIRVNLERWRWLPLDLGITHIMVNIADFHLAVVENGADVLSMKVIVGKPYRKTPIFSARMTYLVLSPYWEVPPSIAAKDKLPLIRKDPNYLSANNFILYQGWGADARIIDPATVNWSALGPNSFPYRLRQTPGPGNALGRIKFMFPNKHNVYIHDTPSRDLFDKTQRNFSSGCIRIQKPLELAEYLLRETQGWTMQAIEEAVNKHVERTVSLPHPVPVHIMYFTVFSDKNGSMQFRNDIYERDAGILEALNRLALN
ncbi:MAG: L,D-transpeptidase family protein [Desulfatibacillum sp.]|nr:L,D-transpeptidase family protein [Desulfatibacillum sp.]